MVNQLDSASAPKPTEYLTVQDLITQLLAYPQDAVLMITSENSDLLQPLEMLLDDLSFGDIVDLDFSTMFPAGAVVFCPGDIDLLDLG